MQTPFFSHSALLVSFISPVAISNTLLGQQGDITRPLRACALNQIMQIAPRDQLPAKFCTVDSTLILELLWQNVASEIRLNGLVSIKAIISPAETYSAQKHGDQRVYSIWNSHSFC